MDWDYPTGCSHWLTEIQAFCSPLWRSTSTSTCGRGCRHGRGFGRGHDADVDVEANNLRDLVLASLNDELDPRYVYKMGYIPSVGTFHGASLMEQSVAASAACWRSLTSHSSRRRRNYLKRNFNLLTVWLSDCLWKRTKKEKQKEEETPQTPPKSPPTSYHACVALSIIRNAEEAQRRSPLEKGATTSCPTLKVQKVRV